MSYACESFERSVNKARFEVNLLLYFIVQKLLCI